MNSHRPHSSRTPSKVWGVLALVIAARFLTVAHGADAPRGASELRIIVDPAGWGNAQPQDIRQVALSAAAEIWKHCPHTHIDTIYLEHRKDAPQTNWERDESGRIVIGLASEDRHWAQMAFQFSHEFCHALAMHANDWRRTWRVTGKPNHWLEESLCETASLYVLRAMGHTWVHTPPYPNWSSYAPRLTEYAAERIEAQGKLLPKGLSFVEWLDQNEASMRANPTLRDKNGLVAVHLLPLFEADPRGWEALTFFNLGAHDKTETLTNFLMEWRRRCPDDLKGFVGRIAETLGHSLPREG